MNQGKRNLETKRFIFATLLLSFVSTIVLCQDCNCIVTFPSGGGTYTYATRKEAQEAWNRSGYDKNISVPAKCTDCATGGNTNIQYGGPTKEEIEAKRLKDVADMEAKVEAEKKIANKKQSDTLRIEADKNATLKRMGGASSKELGLGSEEIKKNNDTDFFGIKKEKTGVVITEHKVKTEPFNKPIAWQQLYCAFYIMGYISEHSSKATKGTFTDGDLSEIKYLSSQAINELNGNPIEITCNTANIPLSPADEKKILKRRHLCQKILTATEIQAQKYSESQRKISGKKINIVEEEKKIKNLKLELVKLKAAQTQKINNPAVPDNKDQPKNIEKEKKDAEEIQAKEDAMKEALDALNANKDLADSARALDGLSKLSKELEDPAKDADALDKKFRELMGTP